MERIRIQSAVSESGRRVVGRLLPGKPGQIQFDRLGLCR